MVRRATADDAPELMRLGAQMFFEMGLPDTETGAWRAAAEERTATGLADGSVAAFVVDDPDRVGRLVASVAVTVAHRLPTPRNPSGTSAYVQYVCAEPGHRGRDSAARSCTPSSSGADSATSAWSSYTPPPTATRGIAHSASPTAPTRPCA